MVRNGRYVYVCPACGGTTWSPRLGRSPGKFRETYSLVDGTAYPSCRQIEQLCFWCEAERWGEEVNTCMVLPRKGAIAPGSESSTSNVLAAGLLTQFSELWAFLVSTTHPDGAARQTGSLSLSFERGLLALSLNDTETGQYAYLNGKSVDDLLLQAELRLSDGSMPWRPSRYAGKKK